MTFYNKSKTYTKNSAYHNTTEENAALAFELIIKKINQTEDLYAQKQFEAASKQATETINLCAALSTIFIDDIQTQPIQPQDTQAMTINWEIYFIELIRTLTNLFLDHSPQKKEKICKSLQTMAQLWRSLDTTHHHPLPEPQKNTDSFNLSV